MLITNNFHTLQEFKSEWCKLRTMKRRIIVIIHYLKFIYKIFKSLEWKLYIESLFMFTFGPSITIVDREIFSNVWISFNICFLRISLIGNNRTYLDLGIFGLYYYKWKQNRRRKK